MPYRTIKKALVAAAAVFGLAFAAPGCATHGRGALYVTNAPPPPPRHVEAPYRPGYTYVQGRWEHHDNGWIWRDGYYVLRVPKTLT